MSVVAPDDGPAHPSVLLYDPRYRIRIIDGSPAVFRALVAAEPRFRRRNMLVAYCWAAEAFLIYLGTLDPMPTVSPGLQIPPLRIPSRRSFHPTTNARAAVRAQAWPAWRGSDRRGG